MKPSAPSHKVLATTSVEAGLDFACSLITDAISATGNANPEKTNELLNELCSYIQLRYVGELGLALEYIAGIGHRCRPEGDRATQFWSQLRWIAEKMDISEEDRKLLALPDE